MNTPGRAAEQIATWFGCGRAPFAPGTVGALGALPLFWLLRRVSWPAYLSAWCALVGLGVWASERVSRARGTDDPPEVVIDEVAGVLLALALVRERGFGAQAASLLLFRLFDIIKPGPIAAAERLRPPGVGIMADDLVAGLAAGLLARAVGR